MMYEMKNLFSPSEQGESWQFPLTAAACNFIGTQDWTDASCDLKRHWDELGSDPRLPIGSGEHQLLWGLRGHDQKESSSWSLRAWTTWLQQEKGPSLGSTGIWAFVLGLPWAIAQRASSHCLGSDLHVLRLLLLTHLTANTYWQAQRARTGSGRVEDKINTKQKHVIK